jgi:hypothetical protein
MIIQEANMNMGEVAVAQGRVCLVALVWWRVLQHPPARI